MEHSAKSGTTFSPLVPNIYVRFQFGNRYVAVYLCHIHGMTFNECRRRISTTNL